LTKDERVELILLSGREGWSYRRIAEHFNACHPGRAAVSHSTVGKLVQKFKDTGSVLDKPRCGQPSVSDEVKGTVRAKVIASPKKSTRRTSMELGVPRSTVQKILKTYAFHPYKMQVLQSLSENDPDRRLEMCAWFSDLLDKNARFTEDCVLFSDEANFM
jgi:transposase